jgi:hypothetical protein
MYRSAAPFHTPGFPVSDEQQRKQYDKEMMEAADRLRGAVARFRWETEGEDK